MANQILSPLTPMPSNINFQTLTKQARVNFFGEMIHFLILYFDTTTGQIVAIVDEEAQLLKVAIVMYVSFITVSVLSQEPISKLGVRKLKCCKPWDDIEFLRGKPSDQ